MTLHAKRLFCAAFLLCGWSLFSGVAMAEDPIVRVHGATSAAKLIKAKQADLETQLKVKIELVANNSGRGMEDLATGKADIAMVAGSLEATAKVINAAKPDTVKVDALKAVKAAEYPLVVIVHASNTTPKLTLPQVTDLLSGKIANWKEVGGPDQAVVVVLPPVTDGARTYIQGELLQGGEFVKTARVLQNTPDQGKVVGQIAGALAVCSSQHKIDTVKTIETDKPLIMPMLLVTKGEPTAQIKSTLEALQKVISVK